MAPIVRTLPGSTPRDRNTGFALFAPNGSIDRTKSHMDEPISSSGNSASISSAGSVSTPIKAHSACRPISPSTASTYPAPTVNPAAMACPPNFISISLTGFRAA